MKRFNFHSWTNPTDFNRMELVFNNRNKSYGAYFIRREYNYTLVKSLVITALTIQTIFMLPKIIQYFSEDIPDLDIGQVIWDGVPPPPEIFPDETPKTESPKQDNSGPKLSLAIEPIATIRDRIDEADSLELEEFNKVEIPMRPIELGGSGNGTETGIGGNGTSTGTTILPQKDDEQTIEIIADEMPEYIGGVEAMYNFLSENVEYPDAGKKDNINCRLQIAFVVERDGSLSNFKILKCTEPGYGFEEKAINALKAMPKWKPGKHNNRPARVHFNIPFQFKLF